MYFLLVCLVTICCSPSDAATLTKINYLPNGQVAGYQLIINNTVDPQADTHLPQGRVSKTFKITSRSGNTFTSVDEKVFGENSYLNVHRVLKERQQQARMKYPFKNVLMVPSMRYNNGVVENVKLRFVQIGPYAALIVPVNRSDLESLANLRHSMPSEISDSVKAYVEVQEQTPESSQKTDNAYAPPTYKDTLGIDDINSPVSLDGNSQKPVTFGIDQYKYPAAISDSYPSSETQGKGDHKNNKHPAFIIRVVNPTKGDSQDNGKEFFVPADPDQFVPERDDKIIANPFKYSGASDSPSSSQFKEVYSKDYQSAYGLPATSPAVSKSDEGLNDGSQRVKFSGPIQQPSQHFQSSWSLDENTDPFGHARFGGHLLGQPEFSDVAPPTDPNHSADNQPGSDIDVNDQFINLNGNSGSNLAADGFSGGRLGQGQASDISVSTGHPPVEKLQDFRQGHLPNEGFTESANVAQGDNNNNYEQTEQLNHESPSADDSAQNFDNQFQHNNFVKLSNDNPSTGFESESKEEQGKFVSEERNISNEESAMKSFSEIQGSTEASLGHFAKAAGESATFDYPYPSSSGYAQQFNQFHGNSAQTVGHSSTDELDQQFKKFQSGSEQNLGEPSKDESAVSGLEHQSNQFLAAYDDRDLGKISRNQSDLQFGRYRTESEQNLEQFTDAGTTSDIVKSNQFQVTTSQNTGTSSDESGLLFGGFQSGKEQNLENSGNAGSVSGVNNESNQSQGFLTQNTEQIFSDRISAAAKIDPERLRSLIQNPALITQFKFLSPDGQTTAVLTSKGNSAVVELPSKASLLGRQSGEIVIPKTTIPISTTSTKFDDAGVLVNSESSSLFRQHYNDFGGLKTENRLISSSFDKVHDTSSTSGSLASVDEHIFGGTLAELRPISNFDATSAAAATAAAVAADNEHFKQFGTDHSVKVGMGIQQEPEEGQREKVIFSKYLIPEEEARIPDNADASGSVLAGQQHGKVLIRPVVGFESSSTAGAASIVNENRQDFSGSDGKGSTIKYEELREENTANKNNSGHQSQLRVQSAGPHGQGESRKYEEGSSLLDSASVPISDSHSVYVGVPELSGKSQQREELAIPKYLIPLPNTAIPVLQTESPRLLKYSSGSGRHLLPSPSQYHQHPGVAVVDSQSSSPVGPRTSKLLETLNRIVALPRRHLTEPNPTMPFPNP